MKPILSNNYFVNFNEDAYLKLNAYLASNITSKIFILVDENTNQYCLPTLLETLETTSEIEIIEIESGEENKNLDTCTGVWHALTELGADRKSLLINLGGGVITDLGGFVASCFKRGIKFINIPTTLLSMVDASVGGKTGVGRPKKKCYKIGRAREQTSDIQEKILALMHFFSHFCIEFL